MATASTALAEEFYHDFQSQSETISQAIDADRDLFTSKSGSVKIEKHISAIAELQKQAQDAAVFTNSHDQRVYLTAVKNLQDKVEVLRDLMKPKGKFSFKSARRTAPRTPDVPSASEEAPSSGAGQSRSGASTLHNLVGKLFKEGESSIRNRNVSVAGEDTATETTTSVQGVAQSVVDLASRQMANFAGLHVIGITDSLLLCGSTSGGLHITNVHNSVLVAQTHQFRMHQCSNVVVYLWAGSSPIIEECKDIKFAPLAAEYVRSAASANNSWNKVLDFQFPLNSGPSPNWSEISEGERVTFKKQGRDGAMLGEALISEIGSLSDLRTVLLKTGVKDLWVQEASDAGSVDLEIASI